MDSILIAVLALAMSVLGAMLFLSFARARRTQKRFELLAQIAEVSDAGLSLSETLDSICDILVPAFADFCAIDVIGEAGVERAAARVGPGSGSDVEGRLAAREPSMPERMKTDGSAAMEPRFFERMSDSDLGDLAHDREDLDFLRDLDIRSAITVGLKARGKPTGTLTVVVAWSGRRYRREHVEFAKVLSGRVALSLDNAGLFADLERAERARTEIAETLQHGLLPPPLPHTPGWSVAAMYRPAGAENEIGGDFYDAFPVLGGWMLVIGDVTGHGAHAASIAAQARYTLRTAGALTGDPVVALATLNRALLARRDAALCSVAAIALGEGPGVPIQVAVAGHPPPLLTDQESVIELAEAGPVLGATPDAEWVASEVEILAGQHLLVITDGITEVIGADGRFGEERLHAVLAGTAGPAPALARIEDAHHAYSEGRLDDDAAILALAPIHPSGTDSGAAPTALGTESKALIEGLYDAFNRRDMSAMEAACDERLEFFPVTAARAGRTAPYVGAEGLREYLEDVARIWEELLITPMETERRGERLLVRGRAYLRSRDLGVRDLPAAWIWDLHEGRLVRGEVFADPQEAARQFDQASAGQGPMDKFQAIERG